MSRPRTRPQRRSKPSPARPAAAPRTPTVVVAAAPPPSERHLEVLRAALLLFSERGYAGASLRELARRLGISQPSLYAWVDSKEQLVAQIITHLGGTLLAGDPPGALPARLIDVPRFVVEWVISIWRAPDYQAFVRFLFAIAAEQPQYRGAIQALYDQGVDAGARVLASSPIGAGEIDERGARHLLRLCANGIGLRLIEEYLLYGRRAPSDGMLDYAEEVIALLEDALRQRAARYRKRS